jgi:hypothetical protein
MKKTLVKDSYRPGKETGFLVSAALILVLILDMYVDFFVEPLNTIVNYLYIYRSREKINTNNNKLYNYKIDCI